MHLRFDGRRIPYQPGDTIGTALHRHGERVLGRSLKYHRPRGLYCVAGTCASCFVEVDGEPNVPACIRPADGQDVRSQNRLGTARHDALSVVDAAYRKGFEPHGAFTRPRLVNEAFLRVVRLMSGLGRAPPPGTQSTPARYVERDVDVLIVGGGRHGIDAAAAAAASGDQWLLVDDGANPGGDALWDPAQAEVLAKGAALPREHVVTGICFGLYPEEGAVTAGIAAGPAPDLWEIRARRVVVATGTHDAWPMFANNDMPGVLSCRGARRLLAHNVLPGKRIVAHGRPLPEDLKEALESAGAAIVAEGDVEEVQGVAGVERVRIGSTWHVADCVVCHLAGHPRIELLQQAGLPLRFQEGALRPAAKQAGDLAVEGRFSHAEALA